LRGGHRADQAQPQTGGDALHVVCCITVNVSRRRATRQAHCGIILGCPGDATSSSFLEATFLSITGSPVCPIVVPLADMYRRVNLAVMVRVWLPSWQSVRASSILRTPGGGGANRNSRRPQPVEGLPEHPPTRTSGTDQDGKMIRGGSIVVGLIASSAEITNFSARSAGWEP
jgi:hypothetical protein